MWLNKDDYERLTMLAAQSEFLIDARDKAEARALLAEQNLASERAGKDWLTVQLASRVVTKHGGYGLDHEAPSRTEPQSHPKGYTHEPTEMDLAKLDFYKKCAREADRDEEDAVQKWEAEMRGESLPIEYESEQ
jgi:hypothetical protein